NQLSGELKKSNFPYDFQPGKTRKMVSTTSHLPQDTCSTLLKLSNQSDARLYMILAANLTILLERYSNHNDIIFGAPVPKQEKQGEFINTVLTLRTQLQEKTNFRDLLMQTRQTIVEANNHQNYPIQTLLYKLNLTTSEQDFPLFDAAVLLENIQPKEYLQTIPLNIIFSFLRAGNHLQLTVDYNQTLYESTSIDRFITHYTRLLNQALQNPGSELSTLELLSEEEKEFFLIEFNRTQSDYPHHKTLHQLFEEQTSKTPDHIAVTDHMSYKTHMSYLSYHQLNQKSTHLAHRLREKGLTPAGIAAIKMARSPEMIIAVLGILKAGAAYLPIDPGYPQDRIDFMLSDSAAEIIITAHDGALDLTPQPAPRNRDFQPATHLCYIIYTSGTTGRPKGVMIPHRAAVNYAVWAIENYIRGEKIDFPFYTSLSFDLTVTSIFPPLLSGNSVVVYSEEEDEVFLIEKIVEEGRVGAVKVTPSHLKLIRNKVIDGSCSIKRFIVGGEALDSSLAADIASNFEVEIYNEYGPTEATVGCMIHRFGAEDCNRPTVPIGVPAANVQVHLLDRKQRPVPTGAAGEIHIGGHGLATGYLNRPELTAEKFYKFYKTGDLGRWLNNGTIEFIGRTDQQVKIRGYRIELAEIENRLREHPRITEAVVIDRTGKTGEKYLCAYIVGTGDELDRFLAQTLPEYMIPSFFVSVERIPLTANGKIDRAALPAPEPETETPVVLPRNDSEEKLLEIWSDILNVNEIGIDHNFFKLGGHSLTVTILAARLHKELNIKVSLADLYNLPTIRKMAQFIAGAEKAAFESIPLVEEKEYYSLSSAQKRLYILQQLDPESIGYNISEALVLEGELDEILLEKIFRQLIQRHESFRTAFLLVEEEPVQRVYSPDRVSFHMPNRRVKTMGEEVETIIREFIRPFDLSRTPLLRAELIQTDRPDVNVLLVDMHHIISDGTSRGFFIEEFMALYGGEELAPLPLRYRDFSQWQQEQREKETAGFDKMETYWLELFKGELPVLDLPYDFPRPAVQKFEGSIEKFEIGAVETAALKKLAGQEETTFFMVLLTLFNLVLSRLGGREEVIVGTPVAARGHVDLDRVMGMFVNTLPLRNTVKPEESFIQALRTVKETTVAAFENQDYPFEELVEKIVTVRDTGRNPIFDVMFSLQNMWIPELELPGLKLKPYLYQYTIAKFDLNLDVVEDGGGLTFYLEYSIHLFRSATIQRIANYIKILVPAVLRNPNAPMKTMDMIPSHEKDAILAMSRGPVEPLDLDQTIHGLFEAQAGKTPDNIAVTAPPRPAPERPFITYKELNQEADHVAHLLRAKGVGPDSVVGLMVERSIEMIIGILGILKAGGAYMGIDTEYPEERKTFMLEDSGADILLTARDGALDLTPQPRFSTRNRDFQPATRLCYVIYTSGSTGKPKGVMLEHRNLVNLMLYQFKYIDIDCSRVLQFATICFDASFHEIFSALLTGGTLYMVDYETRMDVPELFKWVAQNEIKTVFLPMSFLKLIFSNPEYIAMFPRCVHHIQTAGEQVVVSDNFRRYLQENNVYLHNHYGPSETHVCTTLMLPPGGPIPELPSIGKPVMNTGIYITDPFGGFLPVGVAGELLISGDLVGRGYLGLEEATKEKFVPCPYNTEGPPERMYRTGDLARFLPGGNIEFLGRIDFQVKIRGFRVEPGEIESVLVTHEQVKEAVVIARKTANRDVYLCAYIVPQSTGTEDLAPVREWLSQKLPDYMIPAHFVLLDHIPVTHTGKVDRRALPEPEPETPGAGFEAPDGDIEKKLAKIWAKVLGVPLETVGRSSGFFQSGGHSLKAITLGAGIHKAFHVKIPLVEIFKTSTIRGLAQYIAGAKKDRYQSIQPAKEQDYYPLSSAQKRLFVLHQVDSTALTYNMPIVVDLEGELNHERLQQVFDQLIARHDSLRTSFRLVKSEPVQRIHDHAAFKIEIVEKGEVSSFIQPFDLARAPLMRVGLICTAPERHTMVTDMHHILSDGESQRILMDEFMRLYAGEELPPLRLQYKDFSQWQDQQAASGELKRQEEYWLRQFEREAPVLNLPLDFPRPPVKKFEGSHTRFEIDARQAEILRAMARDHGVTLFMVVFALFNVLLTKISGQEDIVVGTIIAGRPHPDLEVIIGVFINILALRTFPQGEKSFNRYLEEVKENNLNAFDNQDYQFEDLVEQVVSKRDPSRNPLFDVMFTFRALDTGERTAPPPKTKSPLTIKDHPAEFEQAKFDMLLSGGDTGKNLVFNIEYAVSLFKPETIDRFIDYFKQIAAAVTTDETTAIKDITIAHDLETMETDAYENKESQFDF
ncbi:MAG: amino acid adenylation domain-containing protein, partial [bacterium]|nr:amino acid adenylation domain-containing protein [bacterium]